AELLAEINIDAIVADRIRQHAGSAAGRWGNANAAIENVVVNLLRPITIASRRRQALNIPRPAPGLTDIHLIAAHVIVREPDGVGLATGQPDRHVPPERLFDIDPDALVP